MAGLGVTKRSMVLGRPGEHPHWYLIGSHEDEDDATILDFDTGVLDTIYQVYKVIVQLQDHSGAANELRAQFNNDSSANYDFLYISAAVGSSTGVSFGRFSTFPANTCMTVIGLMRGGDMAKDPTSPYPTYSSSYAATDMDGVTDLRGNLNVSYPDISRLRFFTKGNATGRLKLYGLLF